MRGFGLERTNQHRVPICSRAFQPAAPRRPVALVCMAPAAGANVVVVAGADSPELSVLARLPEGAKVVAVGRTVEELDQELDEAAWASVDVLLNCGVGKNAGTKVEIQRFWSKLTGLKWMHSASAGLEHLMFPELRDSPVVLTNARGVYSHSLAEYALAACKMFALDFMRLRRSQGAHLWDPYDVEELRGKTLGIVGYGDIGQATARLARAFGMRVVALRRRTELSAEEQEEGLLDALYSPNKLEQLMACSDYVVAATPFTAATHKLISAAAIAAMKPSAVFVNVGRGKCVDEEALVAALQQGAIRGAALDVFYTEPLPQDSPLWGLENVLLSPHCADRTKEFQYHSLELFVDNVGRYVSGTPLANVCDKQSGY